MPADVAVLADDLLEDVLGNVLANAVEHNDKETPHIDVTARHTDGHLEVRIADNRPGIPDERKEAVFRRDATGLHEDDTGSGFGLLFVDTMMDTYGGAVWLEDDDPEGTVVVLRFQRPETVAEAAA